MTRNRHLRDAVALIASANVSSLSTIASKELLRSTQLPALLQLSSTRLAEAYATLTSFFKVSSILYFPGYSTTFVMARLAPFAHSWEDEAKAIDSYWRAGVLIAPGHVFHMPENQKGWMRVSFAIEKDLLAEAIARLGQVYLELSAGNTSR